MAMFVHLAPESQVKNILRSGLRRLRKTPDGLPGIFAMPVTRNFYISHQWLRELKRKNAGPMAGIYFRIPDEEMVSLGHYNEDHQTLTAAEAVAAIMACQSPEGYEVIIARRIDAKEIHRVRKLPQIVGWRYYPDSHGREPCDCEYCQKGEYGGRKLRDDYQRS